MLRTLSMLQQFSKLKSSSYEVSLISLTLISSIGISQLTSAFAHFLGLSLQSLPQPFPPEKAEKESEVWRNFYCCSSRQHQSITMAALTALPMSKKETSRGVQCMPKCRRKCSPCVRVRYLTHSFHIHVCTTCMRGRASTLKVCSFLIGLLYRFFSLSEMSWNEQNSKGNGLHES